MAVPTVGVRLLDRARCERLLDLLREGPLALPRVRLEDLPLPFGAGEGCRCCCCCCWLKDRLRTGEGRLLRARLEERPRFDSLGVEAPEGMGIVCDRLIDRERLRWLRSGITSTCGVMTRELLDRSTLRFERRPDEEEESEETGFVADVQEEVLRDRIWGRRVVTVAGDCTAFTSALLRGGATGIQEASELMGCFIHDSVL